MTTIATRSRTDAATRAMLAAGVIAGPLFVATAASRYSLGMASTCGDTQSACCPWASTAGFR